MKHTGTNPQRIPLRSAARCAGTMTSILQDISIEIAIFLKKDTSRRSGFRLISLTGSNRVCLIFGYTGRKVAGLEMCWRISISPFCRRTCCALGQAVYYYGIQSRCVTCRDVTSQRKELILFRRGFSGVQYEFASLITGCTYEVFE